MLVLATKPLQKLTGTGGRTDRKDHALSQADAVTNNHLSEVWQSANLKHLLTKPLYKLTITDRQAGRQIDRQKKPLIEARACTLPKNGVDLEACPRMPPLKLDMSQPSKMFI